MLHQNESSFVIFLSVIWLHVVVLFQGLIAAGVAIGHCGEWQQFVEYITSSYDAPRFGQVCGSMVFRV